MNAALHVLVYAVVAIIVAIAGFVGVAAIAGCVLSSRISHADEARCRAERRRQALAATIEPDPIESYPPVVPIVHIPEPRVTCTVHGPNGPMCVAFNPFAPSDATMRNFE